MCATTAPSDKLSTILFFKDSSHAAQKPPLHPRPDPPSPGRSVCRGRLHCPPPHRRLPQPFHPRVGRHEGIHRHAKRCPGTRLLRLRRDGSQRLEPDLPGRQDPRAYRRKVRRALDRSGKSFRLQRRRPQQALRADVLARRSACEADSRRPRRLHAGHRDLDWRAPRREGHLQTSAVRRR